MNPDSNRDDRLPMYDFLQSICILAFTNSAIPSGRSQTLPATLIVYIMQIYFHPHGLLNSD